MSKQRFAHHSSRLIVMLSLSLLAAGLASARTADRRQVADIEAGHYVEEGDRRVLSQGVILRQGTLAIDADAATVQFNEAGEMTHIELTGTPVVWQEVLDSGEQLDARALRIDYDLDAGKVLMREQVDINRGTDQISGDLVRYDLKTEKLDAGGDGGRIRMRITPRSTPPAEDDS